jgi:hypothetical protein
MCTVILVMACENMDRCRLTERLLLQRGFSTRSTNEGERSCTRSFDREFTTGTVDRVLDDVCRDVTMIASSHVDEWKAYVQVVGRESAWATLEAGKPMLRGMVLL